MQLSIIIPTKDRNQILSESLSHALQAIRHHEAEIIVVNDGGAVGNLQDDERIILLENQRQGVSVARNRGAKAAKFPVLLFIDDDMWITAGSLEAIQELNKDAFFNTKCAVLNWRYPDTLISEMEENKIGRYLLKANFHTLEGRLTYSIDYTTALLKVNSIGSGSLVISKKQFTDTGGYNEHYIFQGEDIDFSKKLNKAAIEIFLYTKITCFHNQRDRLDITEFLDREYRGFFSQFNNQKSSTKQHLFKQLIYSVLIPFNSIILFLFKLIPNKPSFDILTFRTIGILSSIAYFKAWYAAHK